MTYHTTIKIIARCDGEKCKQRLSCGPLREFASGVLYTNDWHSVLLDFVIQHFCPECYKKKVEELGELEKMRYGK